MSITLCKPVVLLWLSAEVRCRSFCFGRHHRDASHVCSAVPLPCAGLTTPRPEQDAASLFLNKLDARLDRLETKLDQSLNSNPSAPSFEHVTFFTPAPTPQHPETNPLVPPSSPAPARLFGYGRIGLSFDCFTRLAGHDLHPLFEPLQYDESEAYLEREIAQGKRLYEAGDPGTLDLSPRLCGRLLQSFARNVLTWFPLFDQESFSKLAARAYTHVFDQSDLERCLILLMLGLGALSKAEELTSDDPHAFPGLNYFLAACRTLNKDATLGFSLLETQCRVLTSYAASHHLACCSSATNANTSQTLSASLPPPTPSLPCHLPSLKVRTHSSQSSKSP